MITLYSIPSIILLVSMIAGLVLNEILVGIFFSICLCAWITFILFNFKTVILNKDGVAIKNVLYTINSISWSNVQSIEVRSVPNRTIINDWIIVGTQVSAAYYLAYNCVNRKNSNEIFIPATEENIKAIKLFSDKYMSNKQNIGIPKGKPEFKI